LEEIRFVFIQDGTRESREEREKTVKGKGGETMLEERS